MKSTKRIPRFSLLITDNNHNIGTRQGKYGMSREEAILELARIAGALDKENKLIYWGNEHVIGKVFNYMLIPTYLAKRNNF